MRISAKGEYALKALLDLAMNYDKGLIPIHGIAERQGIPQRYLEQVLLMLKRGGFLVSRRGAAGGYHLVRPPEEISVGEVVRAVEGSLSPFDSSRRPGRRAPNDELSELWREVSEAVSNVIDRVTLADLVKRAYERKAIARPMYHI